MLCHTAVALVGNATKGQQVGDLTGRYDRGNRQTTWVWNQMMSVDIKHSSRSIASMAAPHTLSAILSCSPPPSSFRQKVMEAMCEAFKKEGKLGVNSAKVVKLDPVGAKFV